MLCLLACAATALGATPNDAPIRPWLDDWQRAVARADAPAVAASVRLPFLFEGRQLDASGFVGKAWPSIFSPALRHCWSRARPMAEGRDQTLNCAPYTLYFEPGEAPGIWLLREFSADGER